MYYGSELAGVLKKILLRARLCAAWTARFIMSEGDQVRSSLVIRGQRQTKLCPETDHTDLETHLIESWMCF